MTRSHEQFDVVTRRKFLGTSAAGLAGAGLLSFARPIQAADAKIASDVDGDVFQAAVKLKTPKSGNDKRMGDMLDSVSCSVFVPREAKALRGALLNPFYEPTVNQNHWRAAAAHWGFALVGTSLFGVRKDEQAETVLTALKELAAASDHAELKHAPLCIHGMSIGGGLSAQLAAELPDRTIAAAPVCLEVGPRDEGSRGVPMITIFGERDGQQMEKLLAKLPVERAAGAQWAIAPQWGKKHEWHRANNLIMPFYDRVIAARYPRDASPVSGPIKLRPLNESSGWLGDHATWREPAARIAAGADPKTCWLPDSFTAAVWQAFVAYQSPLKIAVPAGMGDGADFKTYDTGKPIEIKVTVNKDVKLTKLELFNGDQPLTDLSNESLSGTIANPTRGIYALIAVATLADGRRVVSPPNTIVVANSPQNNSGSGL